jgi:hypothetical protein
MKKSEVRSIVPWQGLILLIFLLMTMTNEIFDLPHFLFGNQATTWDQRIGEIIIEAIVFIMVIGLELILFSVG